jgi:hypothetical protein
LILPSAVLTVLGRNSVAILVHSALVMNCLICSIVFPIGKF